MRFPSKTWELRHSPHHETLWWDTHCRQTISTRQPKAHSHRCRGATGWNWGGGGRSFSSCLKKSSQLKSHPRGSRAVRFRVEPSYSWKGDRRTSLVVVAFSSLARILGECSTIHSLHAPFFFFFSWTSCVWAQRDYSSTTGELVYG